MVEPEDRIEGRYRYIRHMAKAKSQVPLCAFRDILCGHELTTRHILAMVSELVINTVKRTLYLDLHE